jgi:predicted GIY-YIG superfamily endonuclease
VSSWWVYIVNKYNRPYVGITTDLENRVRQHGVDDALYREGPMTKTEAVSRERILKGWSRAKKLQLIDNASSKHE